MGLDVVEVVMRCEEAFAIDLKDRRLQRMRTVGDLYELVCEQLRLPFGPDAPMPDANMPRARTSSEGGTQDTVWATLVQICVDQLQVEPHEVTYHASFVNDLGAG